MFLCFCGQFLSIPLERSLEKLPKTRDYSSSGQDPEEMTVSSDFKLEPIESVGVNFFQIPPAILMENIPWFQGQWRNGPLGEVRKKKVVPVCGTGGHDSPWCFYLLSVRFCSEK